MSLLLQCCNEPAAIARTSLTAYYNNRKKRILVVKKYLDSIRAKHVRDSLKEITCSYTMPSKHMTTLTKTRKTIATAAAFVLAMTASMIIFDTAHGASSVSVTQSTQDGSNSVRVTQSTEDGLEVDCEGNMKCEIIGDDTVVGTSGDNNTTTTAVTTNLNQSNTIQSNSNFDAIDEQDDLGAMIEGMVDRLLDEISGKLANLAIFI
jgi:hypothetical protein